jgi:hypothetical protein
MSPEKPTPNFAGVIEIPDFVLDRDNHCLERIDSLVETVYNLAEEYWICDPFNKGQLIAEGFFYEDAWLNKVFLRKKPNKSYVSVVKLPEDRRKSAQRYILNGLASSYARDVANDEFVTTFKGAIPLSPNYLENLLDIIKNTQFFSN